MLESTLQSVLDKVASKIVPRSKERRSIERLSRELTEKVRHVLSSTGMNGEVSVQGSVAKDTWLSGEADLDIFASFTTETPRTEWAGKFLPALRKGLSDYLVLERYAEHPYLEVHVEGFKVNIVPCYSVEKGRWKSATDRTPYHTAYMRSKLTPQLRVEIRLLKKFMKGIGVYGAEIRIGGFSGMLAETIVVNYQSFVQTLKACSKWSPPVMIDVEKNRPQNGTRRHSKSESDFIVVDPVDPRRNLAAAVREENFWGFVAAARELLRRPTQAFFYPPKIRRRTKAQLLKRIKMLQHSIVAVTFNHPQLVHDILWGQLMKLERSLVGLLERNDFKVLSSRVWSDEKRTSAILAQVELVTLPTPQLHLGPPVSREEESASFIERYSKARKTVRGPWIRNGRWVVEKRREYESLSDLATSAARNTNLGLAIPRQLAAGLRRSKILLNHNILMLCSEQGFSESLWDFLDGRPVWMRTVPK